MGRSESRTKGEPDQEKGEEVRRTQTERKPKVTEGTPGARKPNCV